jgi:hypothetical protein
MAALATASRPRPRSYMGTLGPRLLKRPRDRGGRLSRKRGNYALYSYKYGLYPRVPKTDLPDVYKTSNSRILGP